MIRLSKVGQALQAADTRAVDARAERVKAVESELGLPKLEPEFKALYKAIFNKLKTPVQTEESGGVIPPTPVIGGGGG